MTGSEVLCNSPEYDLRIQTFEKEVRKSCKVIWEFRKDVLRSKYTEAGDVVCLDGSGHPVSKYHKNSSSDN